jgi:hypothetical protein
MLPANDCLLHLLLAAPALAHNSTDKVMHSHNSTDKVIHSQTKITFQNFQAIQLKLVTIDPAVANVANSKLFRMNFLVRYKLGEQGQV